MDDEVDVRQAHTQFEAVKIAMTQDRNGHVLKLSIHPSDTPESIMRDMVGTRYMVVLVRMDDEGKPVPAQSDEEGRRAVTLAGTLCGDSNFQEYMCITGEAQEYGEVPASIALRRLLGVTSRAELKTDSQARQKLLGIRDEFVHWLNHKGRGR